MSKRAEDEANKAFPGAMVTVCARGNKFQAGPLLRHGFIRGYEQAEKDTIERAESHLESVLLNFLDADTVRWIIKDFKKAMEEE